MTRPLLELKDVHTHIGAYHILHGVDLGVPPSAVTMLLGRNGAGKTTTLRTVMGLWRASQGQVSFDGASVGGPGVAIYGPYKRLAPGSYVVTAHLAAAAGQGGASSSSGDIGFDVYSPGTGAVRGAQAVAGADFASLTEISVRFEWDARSAADVIEMRLHQRSEASLSLEAISLTKVADRTGDDASSG